MNNFSRSALSFGISLVLAQPAKAETLDLVFNYRLTPTAALTNTIAIAHFEDVTDNYGQPAIDLKLTNLASNSIPNVGASSYISGLLLAFDFQSTDLPGIIVDQFSDDSAQSDRWEPQEDVATVDNFTFTSELGFPRSETPTTLGARLAVGETGHIQFQNDGSLPTPLTVAKLIKAIRGNAVAGTLPKIMAAIKVRSIPNLTGGEIIESVPSVVIGAIVPNLPPVANAGVDYAVHPGDVVELNASGSSDPDSDSISSYEWIQIDGTPVVLSSNNAQKPSFVAPAGLGTLVFSLKVSDGKLQSSADTVTISVTNLPINHAPIVDGGPDQSVNEAALVNLSASASDPDGDGLSYRWEQISGKTVTLTDTQNAALSFTTPFISGDSETLGFRVTVTDNANLALSAVDTLSVQVNNNGNLLDCSQASANKPVLWPANGNLVNIKISGITGPTLNNKNQNYDLRFDSISQDEPVKNPALKDKTGPDAKITPAKRTAKKPIGKDLLYLRAERQGLTAKNKTFTGNGRVYKVAFSAQASAQTCQGQVKVEVPPKRNIPAIDDGTVYNSVLK